MLKQRISKPLIKIKEVYDVVVIGSGYGGSIAASRMARAGKSVCLLEKGREIRPGEYPEKELEALKEFHVESEKGSKGKENGLYQFSVHKDISVFSGSGLGGTWLVNANVSLPPEEWILQDEIWPEEIRKDNASLLYKGIDRARNILQPNPYPENKDGYGLLPKLEALKESVKETGGEFKLTPINVRFEDGKNAVGYEQKKCTNCGDCVTGCNEGAKNTTLMNYLPDAVNFGAEIYTEVAVSRLKQNERGEWLIYYKVIDRGTNKFGSHEQFITANHVFIGAGSLGSTKILLQSKEAGLSISDQLGQRFTGNGDVLGFAYNADQQIPGIGIGSKEPNDKFVAPGPCITGVIDMRKCTPKENGMVIEEGVIPGALSAVLPATFVTLSKLFSKDTDKGFGDFLAEKMREIKSLVGGAYKGALRNTQTFLVMCHDDGKGEMELADGKLSLKWPGVGKLPIIDIVHENLTKAAKALGAHAMKNPSWNKLTDYDLVTVHPLGGCPLGNGGATGVVNHMGQVYKDNSSTEVYSNLIVCDGAIIPRPLGVNPLLTISGLAERNCALIAEENDWTIDYSAKPF